MTFQSAATHLVDIAELMMAMESPPGAAAGQASTAGAHPSDMSRGAIAVRAQNAQQKIDDAYTRGLAEGKARAEAAFEARRGEERRQAEALLAETRRRWTASETDKILNSLQTGLQTIEATIAGAVARVLQPLLSAELTRASVDDLTRTVRDIISKGSPAALEITGPADLVERVRGAMPDGIEVSVKASASTDVRVVIGDTVVETCFAAWAARLEGALS